VHFPLFFGEAADPAGSPVIATVPAERGMNLIDEVQREKSRSASSKFDHNVPNHISFFIFSHLPKASHSGG
jgi:hypothetical protein